MGCRIAELRDKQVVCIKDGMILGFVSDVEVDTHSGCLVSIIIFTRGRIFGTGRRDDDIVIPWKDIEVIGQDTILVNWELPEHLKRNSKDFFKLKSM